MMLTKGVMSSDPEAAIKQKDARRTTLVVLPALGMALLPKLACPACWPAYAGLLSSLGLGFVNYTPYLLPLTVLFLILAVVSLGYRATNRRGYAPLMIGTLAAVIVIVGKFVVGSDVAMYGGIALLMSASLWSAWPPRAANRGFCPACAPAGPLTEKGGANKT